MESFPRPAPTTCEWFFRHSSFIQWSTQLGGSCLWYTADPGVGKSVLCRRIVEKMRQMPTTAVVYFFFNEADPKHSTIESALQAFLHQLLDAHTDLLEIATDYLGRHGTAVVTDLSSLCQILENCFSRLRSRDVLCVLDALDECSNLKLSKFQECTTFLGNACRSLEKSFRLFVSSRPYYTRCPTRRWS